MAAADGIEANAALEARAGAPAEFALHFMLGDKFTGGGRNVQEAIGLAAADLGPHAAEFGMLRGKPVSLGHGIDRGLDHRVIDRFRHALAHEVDVHAAPAQGSDVVVCCFDRAGEVGPQLFDVLHPVLLLSFFGSR